MVVVAVTVVELTTVDVAVDVTVTVLEEMTVTFETMVVAGPVTVVVTVCILVRVKVTSTVFVPSEIENVCEPVDPGGMVIVALNSPPELVVTVLGVVAIELPSYWIVMVLLGRKSDPVIVTTVPGVPLDGLRITDAGTSKAVSEMIVLGPGYTTSTYTWPYMLLGTVRVADIFPPTLVETKVGEEL